MKPVSILVGLCLALAAAPVRADDSVKTRVLLKTEATNIGQPIAYPQGRAEVTTMIVEIPPGAKTALHLHAVPLAAYILSGQLEVRAAGGKVNRYKAGDAFVESIGHPHFGINIGTGPVRILVTAIGVEGTPYSQPVKE